MNKNLVIAGVGFISVILGVGLAKGFQHLTEIMTNLLFVSMLMVVLFSFKNEKS